MSASLFIRNQQRTFKLDIRQLRWAAKTLLRDLLWVEDYDLAIYIVRASRMAEINWEHLRHEGSTDVITFNYADAEPERPGGAKFLHGELFICIDVAFDQAREFRTSWQSELQRYVIHGILHLCGYDDLDPVSRREMKRQENRLLKKLQLSHPAGKLGRALA